MKKISFWYGLGFTIALLGTFWMFLPHAVHHLILGAEEEAEHYIHLIEGAALAVAGLFLMELERNRK